MSLQEVGVVLELSSDNAHNCSSRFYNLLKNENLIGNENQIREKGILSRYYFVNKTFRK